ncbi:hypothetical protein RRG08_021062 [Elysia crispata]|uniref:Uncharacterized protein n=1 Tax=Elysia crispata TaxID=231223 RepID=A0AAE1D2D7_9GAST|nr:hypothetical protein RRG08_021062 [Elysia crispata]
MMTLTVSSRAGIGSSTACRTHKMGAGRYKTDRTVLLRCELLSSLPDTVNPTCGDTATGRAQTLEASYYSHQ